jgi:hypothetical protein
MSDGDDAPIENGSNASRSPVSDPVTKPIAEPNISKPGRNDWSSFGKCAPSGCGPCPDTKSRIASDGA